MTDQSKSIQELYKIIADHRRKAVVLREINSDLAQKCRSRDMWFTVVTLILVTLASFIGFSGTENIQGAFNVLSSSSSEATSSIMGLLRGDSKFVTVTFNFIVLLIFLSSLLNLIFRWKENHTSHFQSVVRLTHYISWLDKKKVLAKEFDEKIIEAIFAKYQAIIDTLPPNDDKDYVRAKKTLRKKELLKQDRGVGQLFQHVCCAVASLKLPTWRNSKNEINGEEFFSELIFSSQLLIPILKSIRDVDKNLWLGGGAVRNYIWDTLTGRSTKLDDIDVIYFDPTDSSEERDKKIERSLLEHSGIGLHWSVKNQVRMYAAGNEPQVASLEEAVRNWPETATAIVIRLDSCDNLKIVAPHGLDDLLSLIVKPTPYHLGKPDVFSRRLMEKKWKEHWPELNLENAKPKK